MTATTTTTAAKNLIHPLLRARFREELERPEAERLRLFRRGSSAFMFRAFFRFAGLHSMGQDILAMRLRMGSG
jgi:hypothetical protein